MLPSENILQDIQVQLGCSLSTMLDAALSDRSKAYSVFYPWVPESTALRVSNNFSDEEAFSDYDEQKVQKCTICGDRGHGRYKFSLRKEQYVIKKKFCKHCGTV